jgi:hypothetical protein
MTALKIGEAERDKRDDLAERVLLVLLRGDDWRLKHFPQRNSHALVAANAYGIADAMLVRSRTPPPEDEA